MSPRVRGAEAVHEGLAPQGGGRGRPRAVAPDVLDRVGRLVLPVGRDPGGLRDEARDLGVAAGLAQHLALGAVEGGATAAVRLEEAPVGGEEVAAHARLLVEHRGQHQLAGAGQLVRALGARALLGGGGPDGDGGQQHAGDEQEDGQADAFGGRPVRGAGHVRRGGGHGETPPSSAASPRG